VIESFQKRILLKIRTGNNKFQKESNKKLILNIIRKKKRISRMGIACELGIRPSTVTALINELKCSHQILESGIKTDSTPTGGRKQTLLEINRNFGAIAGIELLPDRFKLILTDITGEIILKEAFEINLLNPGIEESLEIIHKAVREKVEMSELPLLSINFAVGGVVISDENTVRNSIDLKLKDFDFQSRFADKVKIPVLVENDSRACAYGEKWLSGEEFSSNFLYIYAKRKRIAGMSLPVTGISFILNNRIYNGAHYSSGELSPHFRRKVQKRIAEQALKHKGKSDKLIADIFTFIIDDLMNLITFIDPGRICLGSELSEYAEAVRAEFQKAGRNSYFSDLPEISLSRLSEYGEYEAAYGAATLFLDKWYSIPQIGAEEKH